MYTQKQIEKTANWVAKEIGKAAAKGWDARAWTKVRVTLDRLRDCQSELATKLGSLARDVQSAADGLANGRALDEVVRDNGRQIDVLVERRAQLTKAVELAFLALGLDPDGISAIPDK